MSYLHGCDISFHGKLRSCNCLIDGRFVLKISDFGLTSLSTPVEVIKDANYYNSKFSLLLGHAVSCSGLISEMLWVAPELLPLTLVPGNPATQKGDVYSFAIILEEIIVRGGPYDAARRYLEVEGR